MKKLLLIFLINILIQSTCISQKINSIGGGTTVILSLYKDTIWIAADSKQFTIFKQKNDTVYTTVKKIYSYDNVRYGFIGNVILDGKDWADSIVKFYLNYNSNYLIENKIESAIIDISKFIDSTINKRFDKPTDDICNKAFMSAFFAYTKNGKPFLGYMDYYLMCNDLGWSIENKWNPIKDGSMVELGYSRHIVEFLDRNKDYFFKAKNKIHALKKLIEIQIKGTPTFVGKPIDINIITKKDIKEYRFE